MTASDGAPAMFPTTNEPVLLRGFAVQGIGSLVELVEVGPLQKLTFLVGRNNHGKSTILKASSLFGAVPAARKSFVDNYLDARGPRNPSPKSEVRRKILARIVEGDGVPGTSPWARFLRRAEQSEVGNTTSAGEFEFWVDLAPQEGLPLDISPTEMDSWSQLLGFQPDSAYLAQLFADAAGLAPNGNFQWPGPKWRFIPAFRGITVPIMGQEEDLEAGLGLIQELHRWQTPDSKSATYIADLEAFGKLSALLQDVLEDSTAKIVIPHNLRAIQFVTRQHTTPLDIDELGDGIKQVIMIGASALRNSKTLICLEEPEIHLHPGLQRKLITHLRERTDNQYLISTHSTHILDSPGAAIFHVVHDGATTRVVNAMQVDDLVRVSEDLGYRASDLLQANYVIWVEGPADRLYWRRWLELVDPVLQEGVHYTTISYGGSLLAHLSLSSGTLSLHEGLDNADWTEPVKADLVDLLRLGRNCTVIADSDKSAAAEPLRHSLTELREEANNSRTGELLVLETVRTVENLLPPAVLEKAIHLTHPSAKTTYRAPDDRHFGRPFVGLDVTPDKVRIARTAVPLLHSTAQLDVDFHLGAVLALANRIRAINGIATRESND